MDQSKQTEAVFKSSRNEVDPVSGNEVPAGALPEEVRDDVPAMLSEGEYVVPADVLRYYGVKFFEDLRNEAKMGLTELDAGGRIGGEPMEEEGDDLPFSDEELMAIDDGEEATPGFAEGGLNMPSYLKAPDMSMFGFDAGTSASSGGVEFRTYVNSSGMEITIPFFDGEPLGAIPAGYSLKSDATEAVQEEAKKAEANQREPGDGGPANEGRSAATENDSSQSSGKGLGLSENVADAIGKGIVGLGKAALGSVTGLGPLGIGLASKATDIDEQLAETISQSLQGNGKETNVSVEDITEDAIAQSTGVSPSSVSSSTSRGGGNEGRGGNEASGVDGPAPGANADGNAPGVSAAPGAGANAPSAGAASSAAAGSGHEGNADPDAGGSMLAKGGLVKRRSKKKK